MNKKKFFHKIFLETCLTYFKDAKVIQKNTEATNLIVSDNSFFKTRLFNNYFF